MTDPRLYIIMRNDLPSLNPGKLAAQAAHVANVAVKRGAPKVVRQWERQTGQGFGTTIVLAASLDFLKKHLWETVVRDPTYPCEIPYEVSMHLVAHFGGRYCLLDHPRKKAFYLRNEIVGAWKFGQPLPAFDELALYP